MPYRWWQAALATLVGIEPSEVVQAVTTGRRLVRQGSSLGLPVVSIWARTGAGRPLIVVLRHEGGMSWLIVGVLDMTPEQVAEFEHWEASP
jgi:hypothetical protein